MSPRTGIGDPNDCQCLESKSLDGRQGKVAPAASAAPRGLEEAPRHLPRCGGEPTGTALPFASHRCGFFGGRGLLSKPQNLCYTILVYVLEIQLVPLS